MIAGLQGGLEPRLKLAEPHALEPKQAAEALQIAALIDHRGDPPSLPGLRQEDAVALEIAMDQHIALMQLLQPRLCCGPGAAKIDRAGVDAYPN
jgi:hypothetical protein